MEIVLRLLESRKHVFVEKPLTYKSGDGERLVSFLQKEEFN